MSPLPLGWELAKDSLHVVSRKDFWGKEFDPIFN